MTRGPEGSAFAGDVARWVSQAQTQETAQMIEHADFAAEIQRRSLSRRFSG